MRCHEVPEYEIVTVVFSDGGETPCAIEAVAADNHSWSESKFHSFEHFRHQHARGHLHRHTHRFEAGPEAALLC